MTIAQLVYDNEKHFHLTDQQVQHKASIRLSNLKASNDPETLQLMRIWRTMDDCIRAGVTSKVETLPGRLGLKRKAPMLYRRLMRG